MADDPQSSDPPSARLPVLPLRGLVAFPSLAMPLLVGRELSVTAAHEALGKDQRILLLAQREPECLDPEPDDLFRMGSVAYVHQCFKNESGTHKVIVEVADRAQVLRLTREGGCLWAEVRAVVEPDVEEPEGEALMRTVRARFLSYMQLQPTLPEGVGQLVTQADTPSLLADTVAAYTAIPFFDKQQLLEMADPMARLGTLADILENEIALLEIQRGISERVRTRLSKSQKEYFLKEQLKAIEEERILEYLAVKKLSNRMREPILCFVGPPGVGKTSLAGSVARALGRRVVRKSLGGVRDEAEIRGHRRTYVGALPGRMIQSIRKAGVRNPVFLLDEIDKMGQDNRGDPASALLEVLDPDENYAFSDHYLEVEFDLSEVLFICTANVAANIPPVLMDRLEMIELSGYTLEEKTRIAERHLMPRELQAPAHRTEGKRRHRHMPGVDRVRRAQHGHRVFVHAGRRRPDPDRPTRGCDAGVRQDGPVVGAVALFAAGRDPDETDRGPARPRAGRRNAERRPERGVAGGLRAGVGHERAPRPAQHRHDRRSDTPGQGAACRRHQGEGSGGPSRGHHRRLPPRGKRRRPGKTPR